ncbi:MAG: 50S ribosomal protein L1 [Nitrospirae bacterium]|nr:50S ribosomal protein L1 [Nitrospirota bacterium]
MGKKYDSAKQRVGAKLYSLQAATDLVKQLAFAKFDETVELTARLNVDPKQADQMVRGAVVLPHGSGQKVRVLVFAKGEKEKEAQQAGADYVGAENYAEKINGGWLEFEQVIATPDLMGMVGKLGKVLGPRGLMPNPKTGTVTFDVAKAVQEVKRGRVEYKVDKAGNVHVVIGKVSFTPAQLYENALSIVSSVWRAKPASAKGVYIGSLTVSSTMGPGVPIDSTGLVKTL